MSARDVVEGALDALDEEPTSTSNRRMADAILSALRAAGYEVVPREGLAQLDFGGDLDAFDNLQGAIIDMQRSPEKPPDRVCWETINRVLGQLGHARAMLAAQEPTP